jgi:glycosyltransferase involved in cell wall biosynthesis
VTPVLGLLPDVRGSLGALARTGQHARLIRGYFRPYVAAFRRVVYFSYRSERLEDFTSDPAVLEGVRLVPGSRRDSVLYSVALPIRHAAELRACDVIRVFQATGTLPAVIARRRFDVPFVTSYGFWYERLARNAGTRLLRRAVTTLGLRAASAVICTTPELAAHVSRRAPAARIALIPNGVDTQLFAPRARPAGATRTVIYVGRLSPEKNLASLVEAAGKLVGRWPLRLVFVGDGAERPALQALATERGVDAQFVPVVSHERLPDLLAGAEAFVLPSFTEGHPKALLEAMSAGLACVASDVGGNRAILRHEQTGLLYEVGDTSALVDALGRVLADRDLAGRLGAQARDDVLARYDLTRLVGEEIALLQHVARR